MEASFEMNDKRLASGGDGKCAALDVFVVVNTGAEYKCTKFCMEELFCNFPDVERFGEAGWIGKLLEALCDNRERLIT